MASIKQRGDLQWRVQIRRKDHKPIYRTFESYAAAKKWADEIEGRISGESYIDRSEAKATKLRELLTQYQDEVTPAKKGADRERYRIAQWLREEMAEWPVLAVQPKDIAEWRRKQEAAGKAPSTINNAINLLSSVFRTAISEWGYTNLIVQHDDFLDIPNRGGGDMGYAVSMSMAEYLSTSEWALPQIMQSPREQPVLRCVSAIDSDIGSELQSSAFHLMKQQQGRNQTGWPKCRQNRISVVHRWFVECRRPQRIG